jgi:hypothetical protein
MAAARTTGLKARTATPRADFMLKTMLTTVTGRTGGIVPEMSDR